VLSDVPHDMPLSNTLGTRIFLQQEQQKVQNLYPSVRLAINKDKMKNFIHPPSTLPAESAPP
jgi:hypothetical protein